MKELYNPKWTKRANPILLVERLEKLAKAKRIKLTKIKLDHINRVIFIAVKNLTYKGWLVDLDTYQIWCETQRFTTLPDTISYFINNTPYKMKKDEYEYFCKQMGLKSLLNKHKDKF